MLLRTRAALVAALLLLAPPTSHAALSAYSQNFESLVLTAPTALANDGWLVYGNVYNPAGTTWLYGYGPYPAPNDGAEPFDGFAFCGIVNNQGGTGQGAQQLSVYSDYNNTGAHGAGQRVESNVFHEQTISAGDVGANWLFQFDAKLGNLTGSSTAMAFIKTLDPANGYALTNFLQVNTTSIPATWSTYSISISINAGLVGQILQFGFLNNASNTEGSGVFYDNVSWARSTTGVGGASRTDGLELRDAAPNPLRSSTRIVYSIARRGIVDLGVYDITGRRVATLFHGQAEPGSHVATWDGRSMGGRLAPAGVYRYVLETAEGRQARSMVVNR